MFICADASACAFSHYATERLTIPYSGGPARLRRVPSQQATIAMSPLLALLIAGVTNDVACRKSQEIFVAAIPAFDTGESVVQIAAVCIPVNDLLDIGPPKALPGLSLSPRKPRRPPFQE